MSARYLWILYWIKFQAKEFQSFWVQIFNWNFYFQASAIIIQSLLFSDSYKRVSRSSQINWFKEKFHFFIVKLNARNSTVFKITKTFMNIVKNCIKCKKKKFNILIEWPQIKSRAFILHSSSWDFCLVVIGNKALISCHQP